MRGEGNSVVGIGVGSTVIAGAGISHVAQGLGKTVDVPTRALGSAVAAGSYAWDEDGNFVCSRFVFNFKTGEIFDGCATYKASSIERMENHGNVIKIYRGTRIHTVPVGIPQRADAALHLIDLMQKGVVLEPEGKRIKSYDHRAGKIGAVRLVSYAWLSLFVALPLTMLYAFHEYGLASAQFSWFEYKVAYVISFATMIGIKKLMPVHRPNWSTME